MVAGVLTKQGSTESPTVVSASFDPGRDSDWQPLSPVRYRNASDAHLAASSGRVALWPSTDETISWLLKPGRSDWERVAAPPLPSGATVDSAAGSWIDGDLVTVFSYTTPDVSSTAAAVYRNGRWAVTDPMEFTVPFPDLVVADGRIVVTGGIDGGPVVIDPRSGAWKQLQGYPFGNVIDSAAAWTGSTLVLWGGILQSEAGSGIVESAGGALIELE